MATARRVALTPTEVFLTEEERAAQNALAHPPAPDDDDEQTPADRVAAALADFRDDERASVKLYKRGIGKIEWCADYAVLEFEAGGMEMIRRDWGPGEYEIRLYATKPGTNYYVVRAKTAISIRAKLNDNNPTPQPQQQGGGELAQVLAAMAAQQQAMMEMLARPAAPAPDPMAQMTQMFTMMKLMREATAAPPAPSQSPISEIVAAVRELRSVSSEINPPAESDKEPSLMQLAGQMMPMVQQLLPQRQPNPAPGEFPVIGLPPSIASAQMPEADPAQMEIPNMPQAAQPQQNPTPEDDVNALQKLNLLNLLNRLVAMARGDADKEAAADLVLEKAPDEVIDFLDTDGEEWWQVLVGAAPFVEPHKAYFFEVQKLVRAGLDEPEAEGEKK